MGNWNSPGSCWSSNLLLSGQTWPLGLCKMLLRLCHPPQDGGLVASPQHSVWPKGGKVVMSPVVSPRVCPGDLRLCFCPTLQLSCPGQGWELQTGGKTGCWGRWGGYFICSSGGSLPLNVSLGTDFSFFSTPVPCAGWFTWPLSIVSQMWHSAALLSFPESCWRSRMTFSRYDTSEMGRGKEAGRCHPTGCLLHQSFP